MSTTTRTRAMEYVESRINRPLDEALRAMYHEQGMTLAEIADEFGCGISTVHDWMRAFGIETRVIGLRAARRVRMAEATTAA